MTFYVVPARDFIQNERFFPYTNLTLPLNQQQKNPMILQAQNGNQQTLPSIVIFC